MGKRIIQVLVAYTALAMGTVAFAVDRPPKPPQKRVAFAKGASSATIKGTLKGHGDVDYLVRAAAGQTLEVKLEATNGQNNFNVLPPGSANVAMYSSRDTGEQTYRGVLPADGDYAIRVYLDRPAARRNEASSYTLTVGVSGKALPPLPAARDAKVAGTPFHATAQVSCMPPFATAPTLCDAGVIRRGRDGTATVELHGTNRQVVRHILFVQGKATASDSMDPLSSSKKDDMNTVKVGEERYDIPDAFLTGG